MKPNEVIDNIDSLLEKILLIYPEKSYNGRHLKYRKHSCRIKLKRFILKNQKYTTEQILNAVKEYVKEKEKDDLKWIQNLEYFIEKNGDSLLYDYCEEVSKPDYTFDEETPIWLQGFE